MTESNAVHGGQADRFGGWSWSKPRHGEHFRRCSYCGSIHPHDLEAAIAAHEAGAAEWADRKYGWPHKFYVSIAKRNASEIVCVGGRYGGTGDPGERFADMVHISELTPEQRAVAIRDGHLREDDITSPDRRAWLRFGTKDSHFGKFYTAHLADPAISQHTKDALARWSGLAFDFTDDGRVSWRAPS